MHMQQTAIALGGNQQTTWKTKVNAERNNITARLVGAGKWRKVALKEFVRCFLLSIKFYMMARSNANCSESASSLLFNSEVHLKLKWNKWIEVEVRFEISQVCKAYWKSSIVFMTGYCCTVGDYRRNKACMREWQPYLSSNFLIDPKTENRGGNLHLNFSVMARFSVLGYGYFTSLCWIKPSKYHCQE